MKNQSSIEKKFQAFLKSQLPPLSPEQAEEYLLLVSAEGALTAALRESGCFPAGAASLLEVSNSRPVKKLAEWWFTEGPWEKEPLASAMALWLRWREMDPFHLRQRCAYAAFLRTYIPGITEKRVKDYLSSLESGNKLTLFFTGEVKLLPPEVTSLLTVTDPGQIRAIAAWWEKEQGTSLYSAQASYINAFLAWRGGAEASRPVAPSSSRRQAETLRKPVHGIRAALLFQAFREAVGQSATDAGVLFSEILTCTGTFTSTMLVEGHSAFRNLRNVAMDQLEHSFDLVVDRLLEHLDDSQLISLAQKTVAFILENQEHRLRANEANLAEYLLTHPVSYDASLLPLLDDLAEECWSPTCDAYACAVHFLKLLQTVFRDSARGYPLENPALPNGAAFQDQRFWASSLLWGQRVPDWRPEVALRYTYRKHENIWLSMRSLALFQSLYNAPLPSPQDPKETWELVRDSHAVAEEILKAHWDVLFWTLPLVSSSWWQPIPREELSGTSPSCVLYARLLLRHVKLLVDWPAEDSSLSISGIPRELQDSRESICQTLQGNRLMAARRALESAGTILEEAMQKALHEKTGPSQSAVRALMADCYLRSAQVTCRLALLETEENRLDDAVELYLSRCRADLLCAKRPVFTLLSLSPGESEALYSRWREACREAFRCFFAEDSVFVKRLCLPENTGAQAAYQQEYQAWKEAFGQEVADLSVPAAPRVLVPLDPGELLKDIRTFPPVFSGVFDSVTGNDEGQQDICENTVFRLVASGKTCLLHMNQVVDNLSVLRMLRFSDFRWLCRKGIVTVSCFTHPVTGKHYNHPRDYLLENLRTDFKFSSTASYETYNCKGNMLEYLEKGDPLVFPQECREEMEELGDYYRLLFDCFQPSDLRRYHQDSALRYPPHDLGTSSQTFQEALAARAGLLLQEAQEGCGQDPDTAAAFVQYAEKWKHLQKRTQYYDAIHQELAGASLQEAEHLRKFRKLVDTSYCLSNGRHSCREVLISEQDPDLILTKYEVPGVRNQPGSPSATLIQGQKPDTPNARNVFVWNNFYERAAIARELYRMDESIKQENRINLLEYYVGGGYSASPGGLLLVDFHSKTSSGKRTHFFPSCIGAPDVDILELHK